MSYSFANLFYHTENVSSESSGNFIILKVYVEKLITAWILNYNEKFHTLLKFIGFVLSSLLQISLQNLPLPFRRKESFLLFLNFHSKFSADDINDIFLLLFSSKIKKLVLRKRISKRSWKIVISRRKSKRYIFGKAKRAQSKRLQFIRQRLGGGQGPSRQALQDQTTRQRWIFHRYKSDFSYFASFGFGLQQ